MPNKLTRFCEGLMEAGWLAAILLAPLFFNLYSARIFEPDKIALIRTIAIVLLGAWVVKLADQRGFYWDRLQPEGSKWKWLLKVPLIFWVVALVVVYIVATIFSVTPSVSFWGSYQRLQGTYSLVSYLIIFVTILGNLRRRAQVERLVTIAIFSSLPVALYGFIQRYNLDPIPWGGNTVIRIATTAGNSIFAGAYLIMVFPLTAMRVVQSFQGIMKGSKSSELTANVIRGALYVFLALIQIIALYMTGSRGPMLGFLAGLVFFALLVLFILRLRKITAIATVLVGILLAFLIVFQIPGGPFENLRKSPAVGRFGSLLDAESNSAKVRRYIWEGAAKLIGPHDPLIYPDGTHDALNLVRPLIGYGPESMYVAYNQFYIPELGQVERRNASPDRSHNETWDYLVQTGVLGLLVYVGLFESIFYYSLKYMGLIRERKQKIIFFALTGTAGLVGAVGLAIWREVAYFGVGLPLGIVVGVGLFILYESLLGARLEKPGPNQQARLMVLAALLAAIIGHYVEINFGIAIASTRTYFWVFAAVIIASGYLLPLHGEYRDDSQSLPQESVDEPISGKAKKKASRSFTKVNSGLDGWLKNALVYGSLLGLGLMSMGYGFILNSQNSTSPFTILWNGLTRLKEGDSYYTRYSLLGLFLATFLLGGLLMAAEILKDENWAKWKKTVGYLLGIGGIMGLVYLFWNAILLATLQGIKPTNSAEMISQIDRVGGLLTWFYIFAVIAIGVTAYFLAEPASSKRGRDTMLTVFAGVGLGLVLTLAMYYTNLRIVHADVTFKMAESFNRDTQWGVAAAIYEYARKQAPNEDHYYLFLARANMELARETETEEDIRALVVKTEDELLRAQRINPLNTDHTANLARLYTWYTSKATEEAERANRAQKAYDYYATALKLSPQNSTLWGEWATVTMQLMERPDEAYQMIESAIGLDPRYLYTQGLAGDYWKFRANNETDETLKNEYLENAAEFYLSGARVARTTEKSDKLTYLKDAGVIYYQIGKLPEAAAAWEELLAAGPAPADVYAIEKAIAEIYLQLGDKQNALLHAEAALAAAPADKEAEIQLTLDQIRAMP